MPWAPRSEIKFLFDLHLYLAEKYCKNLKMPGAQLNVNPARAITLFVGVTIYRTFFINNSPPRQFLCNKILLKKVSYSKGNARGTKVWVERAWAPWPYIIPITGCFHDKTITSKENIGLDCCLLLKYCTRQCTGTLLSPIPGPNHS